LCVVIAREDVEVVSIDLNITAERQVGRGDELVVLVNILVFAALQELSFENTRVLLGGLINRDRIVGEEERYDKPAVDIFRDASIKLSSVSQYLSLVVDSLEEVLLGFLGDQSVDVSEGVDLISEAVVRGDLTLDGLGGSRVVDLTDVEDLALLLLVEGVGERIHALDVEVATVGIDETVRLDHVPCEVVVTHVHKARLSHLEVSGKSLSLHEKSEVVAAVIRVMHLSDFDGVVSQEVVNNEGEVVEAGVEPEDAAVVVQELFLALHAATTERLLHVLLQGGVTEDGLRDLLLREAVNWDLLRLALGSALGLKSG
jgi:hypothetical protein